MTRDWISVRNVLPDPEGQGRSVEVLAYAPMGTDQEFVGKARYYFQRRIWQNSATSCPIMEVTHWQPLPELS